MATRNERVAPALIVPPGVTLKSELEARGISQKDFATAIGMRPSHLSELIHGKRTITVQIARKLEEQLNIPARLWLNLQTNYDLDIAQSAQPDNVQIASPSFSTYDSFAGSTATFAFEP
jgi:HTH-type transcriptional regulator/antitoxin HigA